MSLARDTPGIPTRKPPPGGVMANTGTFDPGIVNYGGGGGSPFVGGGGGGSPFVQQVADFGRQAPGPTTARSAATPPGGATSAVTNAMQVSPEGSAIQKEYLARVRKGADKGPDPNLEFLTGEYKKRLSTDTTQRAIDRASSSITDRAAGMKAARKTGLAARGVTAGVGDQENAKIDAAAQRAQAGASADISLGRERDLDSLTLGGLGIMSAPGSDEFRREGATREGYLGALGAQAGLEGAALGRGQLGLNAYTSGRGLDLQERGQDIGAQDQAMSQWLALMRMYS